MLRPEDIYSTALRYPLWTPADEVYWAALQSYATKQATLEGKAAADNFSPARAVTMVEPGDACD